MIKNPSNRHSLPKVIISEVDHEKILEFKIKYEKLARLDRFEVKAMHYEGKEIVFDEVLVNGGLIEVEYQDDNKTLFVKVGEKSYRICGERIGGNYIVTEYKDKNEPKSKKHFRLIEKDGKYFKPNGEEVTKNIRKSSVKVLLTLTDGVEDNNGKLRKSRTERELIVADNIKLYSQIVGREVTTTKEIYLVKRFLGYRSDLLFYYGFVNNFFHVAGKREELWKIDFDTLPSNSPLLEYFKFTINDEKYLKSYSSDIQQIKKDLQNNKYIFLVNGEDIEIKAENYNIKPLSELLNIEFLNIQIKKDLQNSKYIFSALRHALMHFDYDFFVRLFNGEDIEIKAKNGNKKPLSELLNIEFLNIMIENIDKLNIDTRKEFIDDDDVPIKLFGEEMKPKNLYGLYAHTAINRVAFNKLINSFMMENGVENQALKSYFDQKAGGVAYEVDIHQNSNYKKLYVKHKNLVSKVSTLSDGQEIAKVNAKISELKEQMKKITKANSLKRLEHKFRLAFGFVYSEYKDYEAFKNNFDTDIKKGKFVPKDKEGKRRAFDHRELEQLKGYFDSTFKSKKPNTKEKLGELSKSTGKLSLKALIGDDMFLKFILLMFTFMPQELKGEFLGFVKKYYHDTKHIEEDTKDRDDGFSNERPMGLKLKVLDKNIRSLSILKHSLSFQTKYNKKDKSFYEDGNVHGKFYKKLGISHNQEEFNKSVYAPLFKYYSALSKLINDFEIYSLTQHVVGSETLAQQVRKRKFIKKGYYNFGNLLKKTDSIIRSSRDNDIFYAVIDMRNTISHLSVEPMFDYPLNGKKFYKLYENKVICVDPLKSRKMIIDFIKRQTEMKKTLGYDAVNDFTMKMVQLQTKLKVYANKEKTIEKMKEEAQTPNDYYNIYKVKGVEAINQYLLEIIGETDDEALIRKLINRGNSINP